MPHENTDVTPSNCHTPCLLAVAVKLNKTAEGVCYLQAQAFGRSAWFNAKLDDRQLVQAGKWLIPLDLQQWPKSLPNKGRLELDVLQLPFSKVPWIGNDGSIAICCRATTSLEAVGPREPPSESTQQSAAVQQDVGKASSAASAGQLVQEHADLPLISQAAAVAAADDETSAAAETSVMHGAGSLSLQPAMPV